MSQDSARMEALEREVAELRSIVSSHRSGLSPSVRRRPWRAPLVALVAVTLVLAPAIALASHLFVDVPTTHAFHDDIEAVRNAGVTYGCTSTKYCPDANVTRGQMAAFMNRLGALGAGRTPVVNAATLEGWPANSLQRLAYVIEDDLVVLSTTAVTYGSVSIDAPAPGYVHVTATAQIGSSLCPSICATSHRIRHVETGALSNSAAQEVPLYATSPVSWVFAVTAGTHTFESRLQLVYSTTHTYTNGNVLTATYVPFDGSGE